MGDKIKLSFMNKGQPFKLPPMTVKRQEELMEEMVKLEKNIEDQEKYNREINKQMVLKTLQKVDDSITMEHINNMHPDDYIKLFSLIWGEGRELGDESDFRVKK